MKQLDPGIASIYFNFDSQNTTAAELIRTFTVSEYSSIEVETRNVPVEVTNKTDYEDFENVSITLNDLNYIYGSNAPQSQTVKLSELVDNQTTLVYAVGYSYSISASHAILSEDGIHYDEVTSLNVNDWVVEGSSDSGFNRIEDAVLSLVSMPKNPISIVLTDK